MTDEMDLNFVDPPLEARMTPHQVDPLPSEAAERLRLVADEARNTRKLTTEAGESVAAAIELPEVLAVYSENARFIARFLTIELDTENRIGKGIGRIVKSDPPPRFADKFNKALRGDETRRVIFPLIDRMIFQGFAAAAGSQGLRNEPLEIEDDGDLEERWFRFVRRLFPTYGEFTKDHEQSPMAGLRNIICYSLDEEWLEAIGLLAGPLRQARRARAETFAQYFPPVGWSAFFASYPRD